MQLSASSAALDLALSQSPGPDAGANGWGAFGRHRQSQHSLPMNSLQGNGSTSTSQTNGPESPVSIRPSHRHSLDMKYYDGAQDNSSQMTSPSKYNQSTPPKLQSSYSANDVPTMRSANGVPSINTTPNSHAQQHLHNHNASLGRIPPNAMNNRLSREVATGDSNSREAHNGGYQSIQSALQASAPPFGPASTQGMSQAQSPLTMNSPTSQQQYGMPGYYNNSNNSGYNMQMMTMGMQNMQMGQQMYSPNNPYVNYNNMYPQTGPRDSQARVIQQRRANDTECKFEMSLICFS